MAKARMKTSRPRLTLDISPALRRRIKMAAAAKDLSVSSYVTLLLDRAVPAGPPSEGRLMGLCQPKPYSASLPYERSSAHHFRRTPRT